MTCDAVFCRAMELSTAANCPSDRSDESESRTWLFLPFCNLLVFFSFYFYLILAFTLRCLLISSLSSLEFEEDELELETARFVRIFLKVWYLGLWSDELSESESEEEESSELDE